MYRSFLWGTKPARIGWAKLVLPKEKGRIGLPDLQRYYWAVHMTRVVYWKVHACCKSWVNLERLITENELGPIPWVSKQYVPPKFHAHPLTGATLQAFDKVCKVHALSATDCLITPIRDNPDFPPGLPRTYFCLGGPHGRLQ